MWALPAADNVIAEHLPHYGVGVFWTEGPTPRQRPPTSVICLRICSQTIRIFGSRLRPSGKKQTPHTEKATTNPAAFAQEYGLPTTWTQAQYIAEANALATGEEGSNVFYFGTDDKATA